MIAFASFGQRLLIIGSFEFWNLMAFLSSNPNSYLFILIGGNSPLGSFNGIVSKIGCNPVHTLFYGGCYLLATFVAFIQFMCSGYCNNLKSFSILKVQVFHKSHLMKLRVAPSETAMSDVLREVSLLTLLESKRRKRISDSLPFYPVLFWFSYYLKAHNLHFHLARSKASELLVKN